MDWKSSAVAISWVAIFIGFLTLGAAGSARVVHSVDLQTGRQSYERYVYGLLIRPISNEAPSACAHWKNPQPGREGMAVVSICKLLFGCEFNNTTLMEAGCAGDAGSGSV